MACYTQDETALVIKISVILHQIYSKIRITFWSYAQEVLTKSSVFDLVKNPQEEKHCSLLLTQNLQSELSEKIALLEDV